MAKVDLRNGYTKIANELLEAICKVKLSDYEHRVFWLIIRKTYGYNKKSDWISQKQIVEKTGICKCHVSRTIKKLLNKNMITKDFRKIGIQKDYELWKLPKQVTFNNINKLPKQVTQVTQTGNKKLPKQVSPSTKEKKRNLLKESKGFSNNANTGEEEILLQRTLKWFEGWNWKVPPDIRERLIKNYIEKYGVDYYSNIFNREANKIEPNAIEFLTKVLPDPDSFYNEGRQS